LVFYLPVDEKVEVKNWTGTDTMTGMVLGSQAYECPSSARPRIETGQIGIAQGDYPSREGTLTTLLS
jgi:hypothetical protein